MRIDNHIFQTLMIGALFSPILIISFILLGIPFYIAIFFVFLGLFCGALYPDTDCPQSRIFKIKQDKRKIAWQSSYQEYISKKNIKEVYNFLLFTYSVTLKLLGHTFRFLIYFPSYWIISKLNKRYLKEYEIVNEHRGVSHTLVGLVVATGLFSILLVFVNLLFMVTANFNYLLISTIAFFIGGIIHLLQDSISISGIKWLYPFREKHVSGDYNAFVNDPRIRNLNFSLVGTNILNYYAINYSFNALSNSNIILGLVVIGLYPIISLGVISYFLLKRYNVKITDM